MGVISAGMDAPGATHKLFNIGSGPLRVVCACAPAYSDADTCLVE